MKIFETRIPRLAVAGIAMATVGCMPGPDFETESATADASVAAPGPTVRSAVVQLAPSSGSEVRGTVRLETVDEGGVSVNAAFTGLTPGVHAYHVHQFGDCTQPDATSAGPHYPFDPADEMSDQDIITGNLGEIRADENGEAQASVRLPRAELNGPRSLVGRAIVVHQRGNDPSAAPTGDTGARVACGTIGIVATVGSETTGSG